jgi:hypothetical protein
MKWKPQDAMEGLQERIDKISAKYILECKKRKEYNSFTKYGSED